MGWTKSLFVYLRYLSSDGSATESNTRAAASKVFATGSETLKPRFGIEHEFFVIDNSTGFPLGYSPEGTEAQGKYYWCRCWTSIGRKFLGEALHLAHEAGIR